MTVDFSSKGLTKISMIDYIKDIVSASAWDEKSNTKVSDSFKTYLNKSKGQLTAAPSNLFMVDETSMKLPEAQKMAFHNIVAKALYVTMLNSDNQIAVISR